MFSFCCKPKTTSITPLNGSVDLFFKCMDELKVCHVPQGTLDRIINHFQKVMVIQTVDELKQVCSRIDDLKIIKKMLKTFLKSEHHEPLNDDKCFELLLIRPSEHKDPTRSFAKIILKYVLKGFSPRQVKEIIIDKDMVMVDHDMLKLLVYYNISIVISEPQLGAELNVLNEIATFINSKESWKNFLKMIPPHLISMVSDVRKQYFSQLQDFIAGHLIDEEEYKFIYDQTTEHGKNQHQKFISLLRHGFFDTVSSSTVNNISTIQAIGKKSNVFIL